MVIVPGEPRLQKRYYDTLSGQAVLSRFLPFVEAEIAEDLVFRARAKFRFITGIRPRISTNIVFTFVYGVHYPSSSAAWITVKHFLSIPFSNYDVILFTKYTNVFVKIEMKEIYCND